MKNFLQEITGTVQGHRDGHGFLLRDDGGEDVYLPAAEMRAVLHRDRVAARIVRMDRKGRPEGRVVEILERPQQPLIGRLLREGGVWLVAPEDKRYGRDILIPAGATGQAAAGQVVVVQLTEKPALHGQPVGRIVEVLGDVDDPGMEIEIAVRKYGVPHVFSPGCLAEAQAMPDRVRAADRRNRVDLRDVPLVTIDGEDARDFDDAVYCEPARVGRGKGWRLLVAIADVSHYVHTDSPLDVDAYERATSVYFPRRVIPMLPEKLSNGLCSLNPEVDRLCMVCDMMVSAAGEVRAYQFYAAVMNSHARFTYDEVAEILTNERGPQARKRQGLVEGLLHLQDVYRALAQARKVRGAMDLETVETQIVCDEQGRILRIVPRTRNEAHRIIEEAMLTANVCAADFIEVNKRPALFRVHDAPSPEKLDVLRTWLRSMGINIAISDEPQPAEFQAIADATRDRPDAPQVHSMLLRAMQQAVYTPLNSGHFGLAYGAYAHFTSPIRRYPDLLVHRVIKAILADAQYHLPRLPVPGEAHEKLSKRLAGKAAPAARHLKKMAHIPAGEKAAWEAAGLHCSANERRADEASRDVEAWLKCKYMRDHLGETYGGQVSTVTSFGIFVTLDGLYVEGLVHVTELGGDYFKYDEKRQELRGERTGMCYAAGTRVCVQVSRVDLDARQIDFRLLVDDEAKDGSGAARKARPAGKEADVPSPPALKKKAAGTGRGKPRTGGKEVERESKKPQRRRR